MDLVQTVCEMQNFWKSKTLSTDSLLDLVSISSGLLFNGSRDGIWLSWFSSVTNSVLDEQKRWGKDQIPSATLKILLQLEENTKYGTNNLLLVQLIF